MPLITKICLCGDGWVGKTSLRRRFLGEGFSSNYLATLGADFVSTNIRIKSREIRFQIWDLAGQPSFNQTRTLYYRYTVGSLLVFDITQPESLHSLEKWTFELSSRSGSTHISIVVLGNKIDLREGNKNCITIEEANEFIKNRLSGKFENIDSQITYIETSAKTGENVDKAFHELGTKIIQHL